MRVTSMHTRRAARTYVIGVAALIGLVGFAELHSPAQGSASRLAATSSRTFSVRLDSARIDVDLDGATADLPDAALSDHIRRAAETVAIYYGRFPVSSARVVLRVVPGQTGMLQGTTWGDRDGYPALSRFRIGQHITLEDLNGDWVTTHEFVHMALSDLPDDQHWLEEGIATYVEPIARAQAGQLTPERVWGDMLTGMPHGLPETGDRGLNRTHTWGRTYWGGALFCLVADVEIRKQTGNNRGLQDALRAIVAAGGTIDKDWPVERVLRIGDSATGTLVLQHLYSSWSQAPVNVDLQDLWKQFGVRTERGQVILDDTAPLARIRTRITAVTVR